MNENIQVLMINHGLHKHISSECHSRMVMLADIIVKECARLAREHTLEKSGLDSSFDGKVLVEEVIKNHFGVI